LPGPSSMPSSSAAGRPDAQPSIGIAEGGGHRSPAQPTFQHNLSTPAVLHKSQRAASTVHSGSNRRLEQATSDCSSLATCRVRASLLKLHVLRPVRHAKP
jgi:hypothetical protein